MRRFVGCVLLCSALVPATSSAEDAVYIASPKSARARTKLTGKIVDYTGRELVLEDAAGRVRRFPAAQVLALDTDRTVDERAGDTMFAQGQFAGALAQYQSAIKSEQRRWVRRQIAARAIWCQRALGQFARAGDLFLALVRDDPTTADYDCIPIHWLAGQPAPDVQTKAEAWLARGDSPTAQLLGASYLLPTARRADALARLDALARDPDARVAALARALVWNTRLPTAKPEQVDAWARSIDECPATLRAGPYFILGRALARQKRDDVAALAFLRVPIEYPRERELAAAALAEASDALARTKNDSGAQRLRRELVARYPETRAAAEAKAAAPQPVVATAASRAADAVYLQGLRDRGLYVLAEKYCRDSLADSRADEARRADLAIELSRTLADRALQAPPADAAPFWTAALDATNNVRAADNASVAASQLEAQRGLVYLARGELARQQMALATPLLPPGEGRGEDRDSPNNKPSSSVPASFDAARRDFRQSIELFRAVADRAAEQLRKLQTARGREADPRAIDAWSALRANASYQLARALRGQGESYPPDSADRSAAMVQAGELLGPLAQLDLDDPLAWPARLEEIACARLAGDRATALKRLERLEGLKPPPSIVLAARAERVLLALDERDPKSALDAVARGREQDGATSPELDDAALAAYLAAWRVALDAGRADEAAQWQSRAADLVRQMDERYGPYWTRRAEARLAESVSGSPASADVAVLKRAAEGYYRAGQIDAALETYDRARQQAIQSKDAAAAFELGFTAAAVEQQRRAFLGAAARFRELADWKPEQPKAAEAHLLAIYNLAQHGRRPSDGAPPRDDEYARWLTEHLERWPRDATSDQARLWLARDREQAGAFADAVALYEAIGPQSPRESAAVAGLAACYDAWIAAERASDRSTSDIAAAGAAHFAKFLKDDGPSQASWTATRQLAAVAAARLWLECSPPDFAAAQRALQRALDSAGMAPMAWRSAGEAMLVYALAGEGRLDEARRSLEALAAASPAELLRLLEQVVALTERAEPAVRGSLGELALDVLKRLDAERGRLDDPQRRLLEALSAEALVAADRADEALAELDKLAAVNPRDGRIQELRAKLLFLTGRDAALSSWQEVERRSRPGGERWFRANYYQALILERRGDRLAAAQLVQVLQAQYPDLGGQKRQFQELLARCRAAQRDPNAK